MDWTCPAETLNQGSIGLVIHRGYPSVNEKLLMGQTQSTMFLLIFMRLYG